MSVASKKAIALALTFDDLPMHGDLLPGESRLLVHQRMALAFSQCRLPPVTGFLVGCHVGDSLDCHEAIGAWLESGNLLANHTFSHQRPHAIGASRYVADIELNDRFLAAYTRRFHSIPPKYFRYPYLDQGSDTEGPFIRKYLNENNYAVVGASHTCSDWLWNQAYVRCLQVGRHREAADIGHAFVAAAVDTLSWSDGVACELFGRNTLQIGLMHMGLLQSHFMNKLLASYQELGVRFLTLEEALRDPAYKPMGVDDCNNGANILHSRLSSHPDLPAPPAPPAMWLHAMSQH